MAWDPLYILYIFKNIFRKNSNITNEVILRCHKRGLILFWLLFEGTAIRITPPLTISNEEIEEGCQLLLEVMDEVHALEL